MSTAVSEAMEYLQRIRQLEKHVQDVTARSLRQEKAYQRLSDEFDAYRAAHPASGEAIGETTGDYVPFVKFRNTCIEKLGKDHGYQIRFMEQTETTDAEMRRWVKHGEVPRTAYEMALRLTPTNEPSRTGWTAPQRTRLMELWSQTPKPTLKEIAATLSKEFDRKITVNSIRGQVYNRKDS